MSPALFGILQLDRGDPAGYANIVGLVQAWLQDAGGFAMVGLIVYLIYALATPTDKSQSERIRVPVTMWMVTCAAFALILYALFAATFFIKATDITLIGQKIAIATPEPPEPPPGTPIMAAPATFHAELRPILFMVAGLFALLGIADPFARDMAKIFRRNFSLGTSGVRRFGRSVSTYSTGLVNSRRLTLIGIAIAAYAVIGVVLYAAEANQLFNIWAGWLFVAAGVLVGALLVLMLFEAEGPVWAIAKLSFKEAVRSQLLWIFLLILLPFAFRNVWMARAKPADEIRTLVDVTTLGLAILTLFPAVLIAAFGIPNDIKNLNIYTVVSKPVVRFEIVLGRFVGYVSLMTLALMGLAGVSLVLVANSSVSEKAKEETYKARVPVRGKLEFMSRKADFEGTNVGREFEYRKYIAGHPDSPQRAIWNFTNLPSDLATAADDRVPVEFTFDIYKLTKGEQNKGVGVSFRFVSHTAPQRRPETRDGGEWHWLDEQREKEYKAEMDDLRSRGLNPDEARPGATTEAGVKAWSEVNRIAETYGIYEIRGKEVLDYTVMRVEVPAGLFRNAIQGPQPTTTVKNNDGVEAKVPGPRLKVYVKCDTPGQLLGMAEPDLYLLEYERPFAINYLKGMVGVWCWLCIVVGLAVACSTYLSGVLSLLATVCIFLIGFFPELISDVATNRNIGGGPFESISRLMKAEQPTTPLGESAGAKALGLGDKGAAWLYRRIQNLIPDSDAFNWTHFVSEGFNINNEYLIVNLLVTFGYLLPWGIAGYYLMKLREVAA